MTLFIVGAVLYGVWRAIRSSRRRYETALEELRAYNLVQELAREEEKTS